MKHRYCRQSVDGNKLPF